ncbi:AAA family ATPase [Mycobacterium hackensackense]|uniref:AAA family ATPase n=1 Tax=Mycobacterium hackensackense TaxID=228909 RepID=UPI002265F04F|nr:AAA family ATPase [Mycobacterium hackensackense]MCV7256822.1 AAA family ATPase [Mycobacterium hackensackense]
MTQSTSDLVTYFSTGLTAGIVQKNIASAREHFQWCIQQLDADQCDLYRALALLDEDRPATPTLVENIYRTLPTWGKLLGQVIENGQRLREDVLYTKVSLIPELDLTYTLRTRTIAHLGYAAILAGQSRFADAYDVINAAPSPLPPVTLMKAYIHFRAERWQDVIDLTQDVLSPHKFDAYERDAGETDTLLQSAAYLYSGIAYAHLGNFIVAEERLKKAELGHYINVGAESCYYLGLIARAKGDEDAAAILWNSGMAYVRTAKLDAALADPTITLKQTTAELIRQRGSYWDPSTESDLSEVREAERAEAQNTLLAEADAELNRQIGMTDVKHQVLRFRRDVAWDVEAKRRGRGAQAKSLHMAFTGPPGTGKTTVARIVANILCGLGMIKTNNLKEVRRAELVGQHIGETEAKTNAVIDSALDGVLFIDEAYTLVVSETKNDFGKIAIDTILARMENERDRLVVIVAGYPEDIQRLLDANDGLSSRVARRINFSSYSPEEIGAIAEVLAQQRNSILAAASRDLIVEETRALLLVQDHAGRRLIDVAGNGRFVRNVIEAAEEYRSLRVGASNMQALSDEEFFSLVPEDVALALRDKIDPLLGRHSPTPPTTPHTGADNSGGEHQWHGN